ncbi:MAG: tetratricopeptide repeat protein, partial [Chloroflexota bacterium]
ETLQRGHDKFPDAHEFSIFLAMALYNLERHDEAMQILLQTIVETTDDAGIQRFRRAITFYSDKLNQTWE